LFFVGKPREGVYPRLALASILAADVRSRLSPNRRSVFLSSQQLRLSAQQSPKTVSHSASQQQLRTPSTNTHKPRPFAPQGSTPSGETSHVKPTGGSPHCAETGGDGGGDGAASIGGGEGESIGGGGPFGSSFEGTSTQ